MGICLGSVDAAGMAQKEQIDYWIDAETVQHKCVRKRKALIPTERKAV